MTDNVGPPKKAATKSGEAYSDIIGVSRQTAKGTRAA